MSEKWTLDEIDQHNASYFGIPIDRMPEHNRLMSMPMNEWPDSLREHVNGVCRELGACGDVIACAVAGWLKLVAPSELPTAANQEKAKQ